MHASISWPFLTARQAFWVIANDVTLCFAFEGLGLLMTMLVGPQLENVSRVGDGYGSAFEKPRWKIYNLTSLAARMF